ncbi:MAG: hypothetical protein AAFO69_07315 [Bacteroidota bacterium]
MKKIVSVLLMLLAYNAIVAQDITYGNFGGYNVHRVTTPSGYIDIGPKNGNWAHIYTDRSKFIFNKPVYSLGGAFSAYNSYNLSLQTNGTTRMTILKSNGFVGIGKTNPTEMLDVNGRIRGGYLRLNASSSVEGGELRLDGPSGKNAWLIDNYNGNFRLHHSGSTFVQVNSAGNVGIGTGSPDSKLTVNGNVNIGGTNNAAVKVRHIDGKSNTSANYGNLYLNYASTSPVFVGRSTNKSNLLVHGKVGIGTSSPSEALEVNGTIRAKEIKCQASPWPDYVFADSYELKPLSSVADYISENGHLPNIPSAAEVAENGIALGEMNARLLEKIEELTLYIIDQEKRIQQLENKSK